MTKRIISVFLIAVLCFSVYTPMNVLAQNDKNGFEEQFLVDLGIVNLSVDEAEKYVTRELLAVYIARMLGLDDTADNQVRYFVDMENTAFSAMAVNSLVEHNVISLPEDKLFRPTDYVTLDEALKMLLCAAGYSEYAQVKGGFPMGYYACADMHDVSMKVSDTKKLTVSEICNLIMDVMFMPVCELDNISVNGNGYVTNEYSFDEEKTVAYKYWNIKKAYGTVEKVYGASIDTTAALSTPGKVVISGVLYDVCEDYDITSLFANYVEFYYEEMEEGDRIFNARIDSDEENIVIDINDFETLTSDNISYYTENGKREYVNLKNPDIIYNGAYLGTKVQSVLDNLNKGTVTVKDKDDDGSYDIVVIEDYLNFVVGSINEETNKVYNKLDYENSLFIDEYSAISIYDENMNRINEESFSAEQVLSVAKSVDKRIVKVITAASTVRGMLESVFDENGNVKVYIGGNEYSVEKTYAKDFKTQCVAGKTYEFKLDSFGNIAYVDGTDSDGMSYGFVIKAWYEDYTDTVKVRMLTQKEGVKVFNMSETIKIDGESFGKNKKEKAYKELCLDDGSTEEQLVRYTLKDAELKVIDTRTLGEKENPESSMYDYFKGNERKARWYRGLNIDRMCVMQSSTPVFYVPNYTNNVSLDDFYVGTNSMMYDDASGIVCDVYSDNSLQGFADAVVVYYNETDRTVWPNKEAFVVDEIRVEATEDGVQTFISGYECGTSKKLCLDEKIDVSSLERGDIVSFIYDIYGNPIFDERYTTGYELLYDWSKKQIPWNVNSDGRVLYTVVNNEKNANYRAARQISYGNVTHVKDGVVKFSGNSYIGHNDVVNLSSAIKIVFNEAEDKLYIGGMEDIVDYKSAGENCSKILLVTRSGMTVCAFIYNFE